MMRVITGEMFNTSFGTMVVLPALEDVIRVGDKVKYDGNVYEVKGIVPPTRPDGKWSIKIA